MKKLFFCILGLLSIPYVRASLWGDVKHAAHKATSTVESVADKAKDAAQKEAKKAANQAQVAVTKATSDPVGAINEVGASLEGRVAYIGNNLLGLLSGACKDKAEELKTNLGNFKQYGLPVMQAVGQYKLDPTNVHSIDLLRALKNYAGFRNIIYKTNQRLISGVGVDIKKWAAQIKNTVSYLKKNCKIGEALDAINAIVDDDFIKIYTGKLATIDGIELGAYRYTDPPLVPGKKGNPVLQYI